jgi:hypothetical protein
MDAVTLSKTLCRLEACSKARDWADGKTLSDVYKQLHRADWWLWLATRAGVDRRRVALAACACARTALKYAPEGEKRPLHAIELTERWGRGEPGVTLEQVRQAAAYAAYAAAYADADAAAYAYADAAAYADAYAAAYAADAAAHAYADANAAAAYAAYAYAAADARRSARAKALADMMPLVREHLPLEVVAEALRGRS